MARKPVSSGMPTQQGVHDRNVPAGAEREIDEILARLGVGIDREIEKMDDLLSRLRRTRIAA